MVARCSHNVSSRRVMRSMSRITGDAALRLAPTNTELSRLEPKCAYWLVLAMSLSVFGSGVYSRIAFNCVGSCGKLK